MKNMNMKISAIISVLAIITLVSCNRPESATITLESAESLSFPGKGGKGEIAFSVENAYKTGLIQARSDSKWISDFDFTTAGKVIFSVGKSDVNEPRSGSISVSYDNSSFNVGVYQEKAEPELHLMSADTVYFTPSGGSGLIEYRLQFPNEGCEISVSANAEWITDVDWSQEGKVVFNVEPVSINAQDEDIEKPVSRDGKIRIAYWEADLEVVIRQFFEEIQEKEQ